MCIQKITSKNNIKKTLIGLGLIGLFCFESADSHLDLRKNRQIQSDLYKSNEQDESKEEALMQKIKEGKRQMSILIKEAAPLEERYLRVRRERDEVCNALVKWLTDLYGSDAHSFLFEMLRSKNFRDLITRVDIIQTESALFDEKLAEWDHAVEKEVEAKSFYDKQMDKTTKYLTELNEELTVIANRIKDREKRAKALEMLEEEHKDEARNLNLEDLANGKLFNRFFSVNQFRWPLKGAYISSPFGSSAGRRDYHTGIDTKTVPGPAGYGAPVYAAADGVVVESRPSSGYGWLIRIYHGNYKGKKIFTCYGHSDPHQVKVFRGDSVRRGQQITSVGNSGISTGPHLHLEVRFNEQKVNPLKYMHLA
ncbi:MAG: hypothetical protein RLZ12_235 [Bacillota bacterium]|jgi:murein DD-endopeptidase MepM/ murein hydrolase activator NlpD